MIKYEQKSSTEQMQKKILQDCIKETYTNGQAFQRK